jgi:transposase InsO family protein
VHRSGLVHHSDRGSQYVSIKYTERLAQAGVERRDRREGKTRDSETERGGTRAGPPQNFALAGFPRSPGRSALVTGEGRATRPQNLGIRLVERTRQRRRFHRVPGVCVSYLTLPR